MAVSLVGSWATTTGTTGSHAIEAGADFFVLAVGTRSTIADNEISSVVMGGQALTKLIGVTLTTSVCCYISLWYADAAKIAAMTNGNYTVSPANATTNDPIVDSAYYSGVDQTTPWVDSDFNSDAAVTDIALPAIDTVSGGLFIAAAAGAGTSTTWTNATEVTDSTVPTTTEPGASLSTATQATSGSAITATATKPSSSSQFVIVGGSLRPADGGGGGGISIPVVMHHLKQQGIS